MINRVVLVGRLTKDPELRYSPSGIAVCRFTVAVNRTFSNQQGEREADFIGCIAWRKQAENLANYMKKGNLIGVEGRIQTGSFEGQDGQRVYTTDVICDSIQFLERSQNAQNGSQPVNNNQLNNNYNPQINTQNQLNNGGQLYNANNGGIAATNQLQQLQNNHTTNLQNDPFAQPQFNQNNDPFANSKPIPVSEDDLPF